MTTPRLSGTLRAEGPRQEGAPNPLRASLGRIAGTAGLLVVMLSIVGPRAHAQPSVVDPNLGVRTVVDGLTTPVNMAFLGRDDFLVLEKQTGKVKRVRIVSGLPLVTEVLDLVVNNASERGLLSIALHPDFPDDPGVYLYWTCAAPPPPPENPFFPTMIRGSDEPELDDPASPRDVGVTTGVPLLGNRVDRFEWDGSTLEFDENLITFRVFQHDGAPIPPGQGDEGQNPAGNHDGGVIKFGPDGKLYVFVGDLGRRGWMQNLAFGPTPPTDDDQFGGPEADDAHLSGVMVRLDDDGSAPSSNPFFAIGAILRFFGQAEVGANLQKLFSYGHRNGFGHDFDPETGDLWIQENADDSFSEINRVEPGMNGGWIQIMGPLARYDQFRFIEQTMFGSALQQRRWPPSNLAPNAALAFSRLFMIPGSHYSDPEFSWRFEVAPAGFSFLTSRALGREYENDLFVGAARDFLMGGYLFHFDLTPNRKAIAVSDPRLLDRVADNLDKHDGTESESLLFGQNFGVGTDIRTGPNGNLYVVSLTHGAIYEIFRAVPERPRVRRFLTQLRGSNEVPPRPTRAVGVAQFELNRQGTELRYKVNVANIRNVIASHIHVGTPDENGPVVTFLFGPAPPGGGRTQGRLAEGTITEGDLIGPLAGQPLSALINAMIDGDTYVNVHTDDGVDPPNTGPGDFPGGEIRGQVRPLGGRD